MEKATSPWFHAQAVPATRIDGRTVRLFQCLFCDKTFLKSQALGGHQNAHRRDRVGCFNDPYLGDPYGNGATLFATAPSTGPPWDSAAGRSMRTSMASHGVGTPSPMSTVDACRLERWSGGAPLLLDPSEGRGGVVRRSSAGEVLDLELRL